MYRRAIFALLGLRQRSVAWASWWKYCRLPSGILSLSDAGGRLNHGVQTATSRSTRVSVSERPCPLPGESSRLRTFFPNSHFTHTYLCSTSVEAAAQQEQWRKLALRSLACLTVTESSPRRRLYLEACMPAHREHLMCLLVGLYFLVEAVEK